MAYALLPISTLVKPALCEGNLVLAVRSIRTGSGWCRSSRENGS